MITFMMLQPHADPDMLGYLPGFLSEDDPRPAREQLDANYRHGGGWDPLPGWTRNKLTIRYPGDPPLTPLAVAKLRDERIYFYRHAQVMILQADGSFEVARMD